MLKDRILQQLCSVRSILYVLSCLLVWDTGFGQKESINTLDLYQTDAPVTCRFTLTEEGDSVHIYTRITFKEEVKDSSIWINVSWTLNEETHQDSLPIIVNKNNHTIIIRSFYHRAIPALFGVKLNWKARTWIFQEHFPANAIYPTGGLSVQHSAIPLLRSWIHVSDTIFLSSKDSSEVYGYYYNHEFEPARPPMTLRAGQGNGRLLIDTVLILPPNSYFTTSNRGLYFFQTDSSSSLGSAFFVSDINYPQPEEIIELTEPLVYITTKSEFQGLRNNLTSKQALDKFWLSTVGSPEKARISIKNYYHNVEVANELFTSYKEGWKTDRGMIYTVMGPPLSVVKGLDVETWTYTNFSSEGIDFVFKKIPNIFSNNHYELLREKSFDQVWFLAIDKWRDGRTR